MREVTNDKKDFFELLNVCYRRIEDLENKVKNQLETSNRRLTMKNGQIEYCTGQYFPTEYRPAACRVLVSLIWDDLREEKKADGSPLYGDIRKAARRIVSRRIARNYFN